MIDVLIIIGIVVGGFGIYKMFQNPIWGIVLVFLVNPFEPFFPNLGGLTIGRILGLLTMVIWVIYLGKNQMASKRLNSSALLKNELYFLMPVLLSGLIWVFETDGDRALASSMTFVLLGILALMLENVVNSESRLRLVSLAMALSGAVACIPAILYFVGLDIYTPLGADAPTDLSEETLRATTLGGNPNSLGIVARNGIFAGILLMSFVKGRANRTWVWTVLMICFAGMILSGSRTNFYGTIIIVLVILSIGLYRFIKRRGRLIMILFGFMIIGFTAFQLAPEPVRARLLLGRGDERIAERTNKRYDFTRGQQEQSVQFLKRYPLFGVGLNRTYYESGYELGAHDTISALLGETGLLGTLGFLVLLIWSFRLLWQTLKRARDLESRLRISLLLGMLIAMLVMGAFGGLIIPYDRSFWMTIGLIYPITQITMRSNVERKSRFSKQFSQVSIRA